MPMLISTLATTRSMTRNGTNSRKPISKARFSSEIMKAGVTTRSGVSRACLGFSILDRRTNRARSSWLTWLSMNFFTGAAEASKAWGSSIFLSSSGLIPAS